MIVLDLQTLLKSLKNNQKEKIMTYTRKEGRNLLTYLGLMLSLVGVVLYDPLGSLFKGTGLMVIGMGLICMFFGYKKDINEVELVNKTVENFEKR